MAKMKEYSKAYNKEAIGLALSTVSIYQCKSCGHPVLEGYVCWNCKETSPKHKYQEESMIDI